MITYRGYPYTGTVVAWAHSKTGALIFVPSTHRPEEWLTEMPYWQPKYLIRKKSQ
jgi:hypothetical protein